MEKLIATPRKEKFSQGVAFAKRIGWKFDGATKSWSGTSKAAEAYKMANETVSEYLYRNGLQLLAPAADPATTWMGAASMDAENSIF